jgi:hypothetical protein
VNQRFNPPVASRRKHEDMTQKLEQALARMNDAVAGLEGEERWRKLVEIADEGVRQATSDTELAFWRGTLRRARAALP